MTTAQKSFSLAKPLMSKLGLSHGLVDKVHLYALSKFYSIKSQKGVTMIEYALIAALVSVATITAVKLIGTDLNTTFGHITNALEGK